MMKRIHVVETEYMAARESDPEKSCRSVVGQQKATELSVSVVRHVRCAAPRERVNCSPFAAFVCPSPRWQRLTLPFMSHYGPFDLYQPTYHQ